MIKTLRTKRNGEYRVRLFIDNKYQRDADYFTDDIEDAKNTAKDMEDQASKARKDSILHSYVDTKGYSIIIYPIGDNFIMKSLLNGQREWMAHFSTEPEALECLMSEIKRVNHAV